MAALPLDVRKGSAFPIDDSLIYLRSGEAQPRRCERIKGGARRKAEGFPHIKRQSRNTV